MLGLMSYFLVLIYKQIIFIQLKKHRNVIVLVFTAEKHHNIRPKNAQNTLDLSMAKDCLIWFRFEDIL